MMSKCQRSAFSPQTHRDADVTWTAACSCFETKLQLQRFLFGEHLHIYSFIIMTQSRQQEATREQPVCTNPFFLRFACACGLVSWSWDFKQNLFKLSKNGFCLSVSVCCCTHWSVSWLSKDFKPPPFRSPDWRPPLLRAKILRRQTDLNRVLARLTRCTGNLYGVGRPHRRHSL